MNMHLLTIGLRGHCEHSLRYIEGYADPDDVYTNVFWWEYRLFGMYTVYRKFICRESVPGFVPIQIATTGGTDWRSAYVALVDATYNKRYLIVKTIL